MSEKIFNEKNLKIKLFPTEARYDIAAEYVKEGSKVVDVGCGENAEENYRSLVGKGAYVIGIEKEKENLPKIGEPYKANIDIIQADGKMLPLRDGIADVVIDYGTSKNLEYGEPQIVEEAVRILKKNGYFARLSDDSYKKDGWLKEVYGVISLTENSLKILEVYRDTLKNRTLAIYQKER